MKQFFSKYGRLVVALTLIAIIVIQIFVLAAIYGAPVTANAKISNWGLGFGTANTRPRGNVSAEELAKNDAYFIGPATKMIYLTFDAGYENGYTPKILDTLKEKNVPAAFFLVSHYIKTEPDLVRRMADEGHIVANHTNTHPDMSSLKTLDALRAEIEPVESLYFECTGKEMPKFYRPPRGQFSTSNLEQAKQLGYKTVFWSLAYVDWNVNSQPSAESAKAKLNSRIHDGAVILLHSTSATNAEILGDLIDEWRAQGYTFGSLYDLVQ
ncbi:MAG: polysaccharide deacetylase family protein [Eubacteriales bacterium]